MAAPIDGAGATIESGGKFPAPGVFSEEAGDEAFELEIGALVGGVCALFKSASAAKCTNWPAYSPYVYLRL